METNMKLIACLDCSKGCDNCPLKILPEKTCKKLIEDARTNLHITVDKKINWDESVCFEAKKEEYLIIANGETTSEAIINLLFGE